MERIKRKIIYGRGGKMYRIIEYREEYEQEVKLFMINISVKEYGFSEFEEGFLNADHTKYNKSGGMFWIAVDEMGKVIGTMGLEKKKNTGYLSGVYVDGAYRGIGLAKQLLDLTIDYASRHGINKIILDTYERYNRAIRFYEKHKFVKFKQENEKCYYMLNVAV